MNKAFKTCKVCGKQYEYCHTQRKDGEMFRWQDVACCPEHGAQYFTLIDRVRNGEKKSHKPEPPTKKQVKTTNTKPE